MAEQCPTVGMTFADGASPPLVDTWTVSTLGCSRMTEAAMNEHLCGRQLSASPGQGPARGPGPGVAVGEAAGSPACWLSWGGITS